MAHDNKMLIIGVVVALLVGVGLGYLAFSMTAAKPAAIGMSDADKNFLVNIANAQVDLTTRLTALQQIQAVGLDWCTANGGQWQYITQPGTLQVTQQQAAELMKQGATVRQTQDGNYLAQVTLINQATCVVIPTAQPQGA